LGVITQTLELYEKTVFYTQILAAYRPPTPYEDAVIEVSKYFSEFLFCDLGNITVGIPTNKQGTDQLKIISFLTAKGMLINE
jgi:hypothetical protein